MTVLFALPGHDDLDIEARDTRIGTLVVCGRDVLIDFDGGWGRMLTPNGMTNTRFRDLSAAFNFAKDNRGAFRRLVERLEGWRERETMLTFCGAPGRAFTLIENPGVWLALPRGLHGE